jgi:hypothetical protein
MTGVGHLGLDRWAALRRLLRYAPPRIPTGWLAALGAPIAGPLTSAAAGPLRDWGWHPDNFDLETVRFMMRHGVEDLSRSLLIEFARWYTARRMSDRYDLFSFTDHLERVRVPMLVIAGSHDRLTPAHDLAHVAERLGSLDKTFLVAGRETGSPTTTPVDLVLEATPTRTSSRASSLAGRPPAGGASPRPPAAPGRARGRGGDDARHVPGAGPH